MGSGHSVLSPSSAKRWLTCTPSARLEQGFEDTSSDAADEGTTAHLLAEIALNKLFFGKTIGVSVEEQALLDKYECEDMHDYVADYVAFVQEQYNSIKFRDPNVIIYLESKVDISAYVPEASGTRDVCIIGAGIVKMIDLKYGKGVKVSAIENEQLMLYALGTVEEMSVVYDFDTLEMFIYQPRIDNISSTRMAVSNLLDWGNAFVIPRAKIAFAGEGEFVPGSHCQFCKVKTCAARAEYELAVVKDEFADVALLTPAEVVEILKREKGITSWLKGLSEYALDRALKGTAYPGMKLVEGKSNRVVKNESKLVETLVANGVAEDKLYKPKTLNGITELEKVAGKKVFALAAPYLEKPEGKPTLVDESDKREAWAPGKGDFDEMLADMEKDQLESEGVEVTNGHTKLPNGSLLATEYRTIDVSKDPTWQERDVDTVSVAVPTGFLEAAHPTYPDPFPKGRVEQIGSDTEYHRFDVSIPLAAANVLPQPPTEISIAFVDVSKDDNVPDGIKYRTPPQTWQRPKDEVVEPQKPMLIQVPDNVLPSPFDALKSLYKIQAETPKGKPKALLVDGEPIGDLGYEGYEFFIATPFEPTQFLVYEKSSGKAISTSCDTKDAAIESANMSLLLYFEDFETKVVEEAKTLAKLKAK